jgi:hypothetical protein
MEHIFRIFDFNVYNGKENTKESSDDENMFHIKLLY